MADKLRAYQRAAVAAAERSWREHPGLGALIVLPTGAGKTHVGVELALRKCKGRGRIAWLAHRRELLDQAKARLIGQSPRARRRIGVVQGKTDEGDRQIVVASLDTLTESGRRRRLLEAGPLSLIVVDEAHHSVAPTWRTAITSLRARSAKAGCRPALLGLTATPERHDGRSLGGLYRVAYEYEVGDAQAAGHLVHYDHVVRSGIEDLVKGAVNAVLEHRDRRALVFTSTIDDAQTVAWQLAKRGLRAAWVSGNVSAEQRARTINRFRRGRLRVLCNAALLTEGTDLPQCDMVVVARSLKSAPLYKQMLGRALRPARGKSRALLVTLADRPIDVIGGGA